MLVGEAFPLTNTTVESSYTLKIPRNRNSNLRLAIAFQQKTTKRKPWCAKIPIDNTTAREKLNFTENAYIRGIYNFLLQNFIQTLD